MAEPLAALIRKARAAGLLDVLEPERDRFEYAIYIENMMLHYIKASILQSYHDAMQRFVQAKQDYPGALVELKRRSNSYIGRPTFNPTPWTTILNNKDS